MDQTSVRGQNQVHNMYSPKKGFPIPPPPIRRSIDLETPARNSYTGSSATVDYNDVFGGPPRFVTSMLAAQLGSSAIPTPSTAALGKTVSRTSSSRSSSAALPVFELPVFGDDSFSSDNISAFGDKARSIVYEDIFKEDMHKLTESLPTSSVYGRSSSNISISKPNSRTNSRGTSPVHPASALSQISGNGELPPARQPKNLGSFLKSRSAMGKSTGRNSGCSSFEDSKQRSLEKILRNEAPTSLPSSPRRATSWDHINRTMKSNSGHIVRPPSNAELDDVFGGFPKRIYAQPPKNDNSNASRTYTTGMPANIHVKTVNSGSSTRTGTLDFSSVNSTASSFGSSNNDHELHDDFIEIRMDKNASLSGSEKVDIGTRKPWITVNDLNLANPVSGKERPARPPLVPISSQLKFKSWRDWTSGSPEGKSDRHDSVLDEASWPSTVRQTNSNVTAEQSEPATDKRSMYGFLSKHHTDTSPTTLGAGSGLTSKSTVQDAEIEVEQATEIEERELQALLANAWKINEKREREKSARKVAPAPSEVLDKETQRDSNKQSKVSKPELTMQMDHQDTHTNLHWKEWRKHLNKKNNHAGSKESKFSDEFVNKESNTTHLPGLQDPQISANVVNKESNAANFAGPKDPVKVVVQDKLEDFEVLHDVEHFENKGSGGVQLKFPVKPKENSGLSVAHKNSEIPIKSHDSRRPDNVGSATSLGTGSVQCNEEAVVSLDAEVEDLECLDIGSSLDGFEEVEGEPFERRQSRLERHVRARERVAKALEAMQQRDAKAQQEQEEKQQLAATSDSQIKRWATGKEGNLRALLSNLQYVLWKESGWKTIPLTSLIDGSDVKKAYRKAALFVHPDKLQQKGATLQQKYIAERVFDILQEAWKTFNMQELY